MNYVHKSEVSLSQRSEKFDWKKAELVLSLLDRNVFVQLLCISVLTTENNGKEMCLDTFEQDSSSKLKILKW